MYRTLLDATTHLAGSRLDLNQRPLPYECVTATTDSWKLGPGRWHGLSSITVVDRFGYAAIPVLARTHPWVLPSPRMPVRATRIRESNVDACIVCLL